MTVTKINAKASGRGVDALVLVDPGPLAKLLGDAEGAAHEDWDISAERPDLEWANWKGRVKFVRKAVDGLVEVLTPPATEPDFDALSEFFSVREAASLQRQPKVGDDGNRLPGWEPPAPVPKWYQISARSGGFTVSRNRAVPMPPAAELKVAVAYDLPQGDPLRNWNQLDFQIGQNSRDVVPKGQGARVKILQGNMVLLRQLQDEFHFTIEGFDRNRDLYVRVDDNDGSSGDSS
jgi:hypothetical protein